MAQITLNSTGVASSGSLVLQTNGTTSAVTVDASQNVGIGVTPSAWDTGNSVKAIQIGPSGVGSFWNYSDSVIFVGCGYYFNGTNRKYLTTGNAVSEYSQNSGSHSWSTAASGTAGNNITFTQAMTLDASGNLLVGTTSQIGAGLLNVKRTSANNTASFQNGSDAGYGIAFYNVAGSVAGSISWTATTTTYSTSSDYRLKEVISPMTGALDKVALLKPVTYKWKVDGSDGEGFIAHELAEVCPNAVTGAKDAVNEDGSINPQGIDVSFLVATLTAAIQELNAKFEAYKASHP